MTLHWPAVLSALFLWWFLTGVIMLGVARPGGRAPLAVLAAVLVAAGLGLVAAAGPRADVTGVVLAFGAVLMIWGGLEIGLLTGLVSGPQRQPCPPGAQGWRRLRLALRTILHHEIALLAAGAGVAALTWGEPNPTAPQIYLALWSLRLSTKLNLYLGVPATQAEMLPARLAHLATYFRQGPLNLFFPVSVTLATAATLLVGLRAAAAATEAEAVGLSLLTTFLALGVVEHWFLAVPAAGALLWRWSLPTSSHGESPVRGLLRRALLPLPRRP